MDRPRPSTDGPSAIAAGIVGLFLIIASIGKAMHPDRFIEVLATSFPALTDMGVLPVVAILIAGMETFIGTALLLGGWRSRRILGIARRDGEAAAAQSRAALVSGTARAFSLVELLVAIAIIAVLIALSIPAFRAMRERGRASDALNGLRQSMSALMSYTAEFKDAWPYLQTPGNLNAPIIVRGVQVSWSYFAAGRTLWPNLLWPAYIDTQMLFVSGDLEKLRERNIIDGWEPDTIRSRYLLSNVAFALPEWWIGDDPPPNPDLFAATRTNQVQYPARKGVLLDAYLGWESGVAPRVAAASRADGSAGEVAFTADDPATIVPRWQFGVMSLSIMSTRGGWRGFDFGM